VTGAQLITVKVVVINKTRTSVDPFCGGQGTKLLDVNDRNFDMLSDVAIDIPGNPICSDSVQSFLFVGQDSRRPVKPSRGLDGERRIRFGVAAARCHELHHAASDDPGQICSCPKKVSKNPKAVFDGKRCSPVLPGVALPMPTGVG
jgi:hypothetical protein